MWELAELQKHFHPSVSKVRQSNEPLSLFLFRSGTKPWWPKNNTLQWAALLLEGQSISYQGNPLQDFTLTAFLDRFSFRNPKQKEREKGGRPFSPFEKVALGVADLSVFSKGSLMQPLTVPHWVNKEPVNRPQFLQQSMYCVIMFQI